MTIGLQTVAAQREILFQDREVYNEGGPHAFDTLDFELPSMIFHDVGRD